MEAPEETFEDHEPGDQDATPDGGSSLSTQDWEWQPTGHAGVDGVLAGLDGLDDDVHGHVAAFEHAHRSLREILDGAGAEAAAEDTPES